MPVIYIVGLAVGPATRLDGMWLKAYDPDANGGLGSIIGTAERAEAAEFPDAKAALDCWRKTSTVRPLRPDGRPNRPLTAYTVEISP